MNTTALRYFAILVPLISLVACGGDDGNQALTPEEVDEIRSDPRVVRLDGILERADTMLVPSVHLDYSFTVAGATERDREVLVGLCPEENCDLEEELVIHEELNDPEIGIDFTQADLGSRGGFDTGSYSGRLVVSETIPDAELSAAPEVLAYGFWGDFGFAEVQIADTPISGDLFGVDFSGHFRMASAYVAGDATGTNPTGMGSATWTGLAEAVSPSDFRRREGTSTITIPELSRPRVTVSVEIAGSEIGSAAWADLELTKGGFATGAVGSDLLVGNFHGPAHEETYGVFDTGAYVGAFGAKREP